MIISRLSASLPAGRRPRRDSTSVSFDRPTRRASRPGLIPNWSCNGRYSWARYYHPGLQRFISEDPIEFDGGDVDLYAYVFNAPADFVDPSGTLVAPNLRMPDDCRGAHGLSGRAPSGSNDLLADLFASLATTLRCDPTLDLWPGGAVIKGVGAASRRGAIRAAGLPANGPFRYVPPKSWRPSEPLPRGTQHGFYDKFGNQWVWNARAGHWDVQLSNTGKAQLGHLSGSGAHVNITPKGEIPH
jgi:hypothetical protein